MHLPCSLCLPSRAPLPLKTNHPPSSSRPTPPPELQKLHAAVPPPHSDIVSALKSCSKLGTTALPFTRSLHALLIKLNLNQDKFLFNSLLNAYASAFVDDCFRLFSIYIDCRDIVSYNIIITLYSRINEIESAQKLFDEMPDKNVRSWTALIAGYVQCGKPKEALRMYSNMESTGLRPNEVTVVAVLAACADLGALDLGVRMHRYCDECRFLSNVRVCNTLIDMYIKCGCIDVAREVFDGMQEKSIVSWSAMIVGHAMHGQGEAALELFDEMARIGVLPNSVTFVGLLHACSHMGLLAKGKAFFTSMRRDYGIVPEIEHYGCMVDLLSRAGFLDEARKFIRNMPIEPNSVVWGALLGGACVHKNVEMGEEAIQHLIRLDPSNDGYYVVLSNIYASKERWDDVAQVRCLMRDQGVEKTRGWSTITLNGETHEFVAGDGNHPSIEKIYRKWDELLEQLKQHYYLPDTSVVLLDMDEAEKVKVLYRHSEKLATVFGLISTPPGTPIRIMKNLRVCSDCHAALKLISEITDREIVVRDRNRFHTFKGGSCSCRDYW